MRTLFIAIIALGILAWSINGVTVWVKSGQAVYALSEEH